VKDQGPGDEQVGIGVIAAMLVYENSWAGPFAASVRRSGGQLIDNGRIPTQALLAAIEAEETSPSRKESEMPLGPGRRGRPGVVGRPDRARRRRRLARRQPPPGSPR
jgi:hypothetical protein